MASANEKIAAARVAREIDLLRYAANANKNVRWLLTGLRDDIVGQVAKSNLSASSATRLASVLGSVNKLIGGGYDSVAKLMSSQLAGLVSTEAAALAGTVNKAVGINIMTGLLPKETINILLRDTLIMGAPSADWWVRQSGDLRFRFATAIRIGMMQGETNAQLIARVRGINGLMDVSYKSAEALVRTSVMTVANKASIAAMQADREMLSGMQQVSTLDDRTTEICIAYDGATWDLDGNPLRPTTLPFNGGPPRHWNCRSVMVPLVKSWEELGFEGVKELPPLSRASVDGQVPGTMTYEDWFRTLGEERQNSILGKGKAELWRAGKITTRDLLDQSGRPLTLEQLREQHSA